MNLEPWFVFVDGLSATTQSRQMDMPRMDAGASAQDLADAFDGISAGFRVLQNVSFDRFPHDNDPTKTYLVSHHPDDKYNGKSGLWIENGVAEMQQKWTDWFDEFTNTFSGTIDHLYSSDEGWSLWDASEYSNPSGNPLFWLPGYWEDQMDNPKWYTYQFWGKTMAEGTVYFNSTDKHFYGWNGTA